MLCFLSFLLSFSLLHQKMCFVHITNMAFRVRRVRKNMTIIEDLVFLCTAQVDEKEKIIKIS